MAKEITLENLTALVNQNSLDIKELSILGKKNSAEIKQNSTEIKKIQSEIKVLSEKHSVEHDDMARATQNSFAELAQSIIDMSADFKASMDKRFNAVDRRFDDIDQQLISIRSELKRVWEKLEELDQKIDQANIRTIEDLALAFSEINKIKRIMHSRT